MKVIKAFRGRYKYNMVNGKGFVYLFITFFYTFTLSIILYFITNILSLYGLVIDLFGTTGSVGIDPFTYALCFLAVDAIFILCKNGLKKLIDRIKYKKLLEE